jgi:hypothetical protein
MATREQLIQAFNEADRRAQAGDAQAAEDARAFAQAIQQMGQQAPQEQGGALTGLAAGVAAPYQAVGEFIQGESPEGSFRDVVGRGYQAAGDTLGQGLQTGADLLERGAKGVLRGGQVAAEGASRGILELLQLPGAAINQAPRLANLIPGVEGVGPITEDYNPAIDLGERFGVLGVTEPENRLEQYIYEGGRATGGAMVGGGVLSTAMRGAQGTSTLGRMGKDIADTFATRPGLFLGTDFAGGFGAGAGGDAGEATARGLGFDETGQQIGRGVGALAGGVVGAVAPVAGGEGGRRTFDYLNKQFAPFTERGSRLRAADQLQRQVADLGRDPDATRLIERAAARAERAPEGVSPARATREPGLLAQEDILAKELPTLGRKLNVMADTGQRTAEAGLRSAAGTPKPRGQWTHELVQRVAAPGAEVRPGDTDQMLKQAFDGFARAYRDFDGYPVNGATLGRRMQTALNDPELAVGDAARRAARATVSSQLKGLARRAPKDSSIVQSEDILAMRQNLRHRIRDLQGDQSGPAAETRRVLSRVENELTKYIDQNLPAEARDGLRAVDSQYRQFKAVEDAAFRGGEGALDPKRVLDSIRRRASSRGAITRGDQDALRQQVIRGLDGEDFLKDRELVRKAVRGATPEQRREVQAKLMDTLSNRARMAPDDEGTRMLSGTSMKEQLLSNRQALLDSGMSPRDIQRANRLADTLVDIQRKSPEELQTIFNDGPNSLAELVAAIAGAKSGQKLAGGGIGASLVVAQFMSNRARRLLSTVFGEQATQLLNDAATDPQLYAALLRTRNASVPQQRQAAKTIEAWLFQNIADPDGHEE